MENLSLPLLKFSQKIQEYYLLIILYGLYFHILNENPLNSIDFSTEITPVFPFRNQRKQLFSFSLRAESTVNTTSMCCSPRAVVDVVSNFMDYYYLNIIGITFRLIRLTYLI